MTAVNVAPMRLPVIKSAIATYRLIFGNLGFLAKNGVPWLLLTVVAHTAFDQLMITLGLDPLSSTFGWSDFMGTIVKSALTAVCLALFAVRWHRHVLHAAPIDAAGATRIAVAYALTAFVMDAAVTLSSAFPFVLTFGMLVDVPSVVVLVVATFAFYYTAGRLMLVLPAIALGRDRSLTTAWRVTEGNGWRLFFSSFLAVLPSIILLGGMAGFLVGQNYVTDGAFSSLSGQLAGAAMGMFFVFITISFLSVAYRELVLKREANS